MAYRMYVGDLKPDLRVQLTDGAEPIDLSTAAAVTLDGKIDGVSLFTNRAAASFDAFGLVTMTFQTADTIAPGQLSVEVVVTWPGSKPQTFRPSESLTILPRLS